MEAIDVLRGMNASNIRKLPENSPTKFIKKRWGPLRSELVEGVESIHISTTTGISATNPALQGSLTKSSMRADF